jgi:Flp pilus assembly protein TadD
VRRFYPRESETPRALTGVLVVLAVLAGFRTVDRNRDYGSMFGMWTDVVEKAPNNDRAHYNLGRILLDRKENIRAAERFQRAAQLRPGYVSAHYNLGLAYVRQGKWDEAIPPFRQAILLQPDHARAHTNLASVLGKKRAWKEAEEHLRRAIQIDPELDPARTNLGNALEAQGKLSEAVAHYEESLAQGPHRAQLAIRLIWILAAADDPDLRDGRRAVEVGEHYAEMTQRRAPGVLDALAAAYAEVDRREEAVTTAKAGLALAQSAGLTDMAGQIQVRVDLYLTGQKARVHFGGNVRP